MKRSIFLKIFVGYLIIAVLLIASLLVFSFRSMKKHYIDTLTSQLTNLAVSLSSKTKPLLENNQSQELDHLVKEIGSQINTRITIIIPSGEVLADSQEDPTLMENHKSRPEVIQALKGEIGKSIRFSSTIGEEMLYVAIPVEREGSFIAVLRISLLLKQIDSLIGDLKMSIIRISIIIALLFLFIALLISRGLSKPIRELAHSVHKVASGDFDQKVFLKNRDELKELADSFNHMTEKIKALFADLAYQKEELTSIVSSIQGGFLVLDRNGKVVLSNESLKKMLQDDFIEGKHHWEILREPHLGELIRRTAVKRGNFIEEIEFREKTFLCSSAYMPSKQNTILIFHDITKIKDLEKIKKDFIVNISHELRTPLTAIKGFAETLKDELDPKHKYYLNIISKHTNRLINIVQDLLLLSELEEKRAPLEIEQVDLRNLTEDVLKIFDQKIKEKRLALKINIDEDLSAIKGDSFKLEQMFINLIDNAINYSEKGEIRVSIAAHNKYFKIEIEDTGLGIPKECLGRIFERFYVVDKSRSRKLGGTGLGLSIVKHIVFLHNGRIDVKSVLGVGTKFIILLPYNPF